MKWSGASCQTDPLPPQENWIYLQRVGEVPIPASVKVNVDIRTPRSNVWQNDKSFFFLKPSCSGCSLKCNANKKNRSQTVVKYNSLYARIRSQLRYETARACLRVCSDVRHFYMHAYVSTWRSGRKWWSYARLCSGEGGPMSHVHNEAVM